MALLPGPVVVLTREPEDNLELSRQLREREIPVIEIPCLATRYLTPVVLPSPSHAIAFLSRRAVTGLVRLQEWPRLFSKLTREEGPLVAAVGRATALALEKVGVRVSLVADPPTGEALATMLIERLGKDASVAVVKGVLGSSKGSFGAFDDVLIRAGTSVVPIEVYENVAPDIPAVEPRSVAAAFVASPSAARRLLAANPWLKQAEFVCIGATTAGALRKLGILRVRAVGALSSAWVEALADAYCRERDGNPRHKVGVSDD